MPSTGIEVKILDARTADQERIELAVYPSRVESADLGVIHIHGKGGNFYGLPFRPLAPRLQLPGAVHVAVNMRCHDLGYTRTDVPSADSVVQSDVAVGGGWWEDLDVGVDDIAAAVDHARSLGCRDIFLLGHSAGGFYAAAYAARNQQVNGIAMLSPLTSNKTNLGMWFPEPGQLEATLNQARTMVAEGRGHHIVPLGAWYYGVSAKTLLQRAAEEDGVWSANLNAARCPVLVMWGSAESRGLMFRQLVEELAVDDKQWAELPGCEHNYIGYEDTVAEQVTRFITERRTASSAT
ncbi:MAG TPA: alpha/beta fold hydrolase [Micromonospora sp.]|nr:alpha/beta fold hydrolase [Micromonospora sp.]